MRHASILGWGRTPFGRLNRQNAEGLVLSASQQYSARYGDHGDTLPMSARDPLAFAGPRRAWRQACAQAGVTVNDPSFAQVRDCFTIAELLFYEAMGMADAGQGACCLNEGIGASGGAVANYVSVLERLH